MYVYATGGTTPILIYNDYALTSPASNPLTLDANGEATFYMSGAQLVRIDGYSQSGALIRSIDPVLPLPSLAGFTGTGIDLNKIAGITDGAAAAGKALVADVNLQVANMADVTYGGWGNFLVNQNTLMASMQGGYLNKLRNSAMDVAQRGASGTVNAGTTGYTLDGWMLTATGANIPWTWLNSSLVGVLGENVSALQLTTGVGITGAIVKQRIESKLGQELAGHQVTLQFAVLQNTGASITPNMFSKNATATDNFAGTTSDMNNSTVAIPSGVLTIVARTFTASTDASKGMEVGLDFGTALNIAGKLISVTLADIRITDNVGSGNNLIPPLIERRPLPIELAFCQRYFEKSFSQATTPAQNVGANTGEFNFIAGKAGALADLGYVQYKATKRSAAPTLTFYNPVAANAQVRDASSGADCSATTSSNSNDNGFMVNTTGAAGTAVGNQLGVHWTSSAEL